MNICMKSRLLLASSTRGVLWLFIYKVIEFYHHWSASEEKSFPIEYLYERSFTIGQQYWRRSLTSFILQISLGAEQWLIRIQQYHTICNLPQREKLMLFLPEDFHGLASVGLSLINAERGWIYCLFNGYNITIAVEKHRYCSKGNIRGCWHYKGRGHIDCREDVKSYLPL